MPSTRLIALALFLYSVTATAFTGSAACRDCHGAEYSAWLGSHHQLAMQSPGPDTVLGDFDDAEFTYNGVTTRFLRRGDSYLVRTDGEDGELAEFEVAYVFGVYPLQQYLLPLDRGRLQALSIAWDARPAAQGGQRWFHLYPDEVIDHTDPLHWTGPYQNWNSRCAECHSTDVRKNYDPDTHAYDTRYEEVSVGCEACHGPGEQHIALAEDGALAGASRGGFPTDLAQRGNWAMPEKAEIARRTRPLQSDAQIDGCGRCHARRGTLGDYHFGADLLDTHRLTMPRPPAYHVDGQIRDEVYVYGSFVQSRMHLAGVVCSNCHEPHSLQLRAPGNGVCAQCHAPAHYDSERHHHHAPQSAGAQCAACHMPETTYMQVDPRRDHSMRIPRPDLSQLIGTPNACTQCHTGKKAEWAMQALRKWGITFDDTARHPARALHHLEQGDTRAVPRLAQLAGDNSAAPIWRATAMEALGEVGGREAMQAAATMLYHDDPLLRASSVRALQFLSPAQRFQLLEALLDDPVTTVRMEAAVALAGVPLAQLEPEQAAGLTALFEEYLTIQRRHADMPGVLLQTGYFHAARGEPVAAEKAYREAIRLNRQLIPAYINLVDLLRSESRDGEARKLLLQALAIVPEHGPTLHVLGLLETRSGNPGAALDYLGRAAEVESSGIRHRFVYAIALHDLGKPQEAIAQLRSLLRTVPQNEDVLLALANYNAELGRREAAAGYAQTLMQVAPGNRAYRALYERLSAGGR